MQYVYSGVSFLLLVLLRLQLSLGCVVGMSIVESASCCYFGPPQTVMEILRPVILVNQPRNAEKILSRAPSGGYCIPHHPPSPCCHLVPGIGLAESCASFTAPSAGDTLCSPHLLPTCSVLSWVKGMAMQMYFP